MANRFDHSSTPPGPVNEQPLVEALRQIASWPDAALGHWSCANDMRETARKALRGVEDTAVVPFERPVR